MAEAYLTMSVAAFVSRANPPRGNVVWSILAAVFLVAASLKGRQLATEPVLADGPLSPLARFAAVDHFLSPRTLRRQAPNPPLAGLSDGWLQGRGAVVDVSKSGSFRTRLYQ